MAIAAEYAGGKDSDSSSLEEAREVLQHAHLLLRLEGATNAQQSAVSWALWLITSAWAAQYATLKSWGPVDKSLVACAAAAAATEAVKSKSQSLAEIWRDVNLLKAAVERGKLTAETPVPQSFFAVNSDQPDGPPALDQADG